MRIWTAIFGSAVVGLLLFAGGNVFAGDAGKLPYLDQLPPLIDIETFFEDPEMDRARISPDGRFIAFRQKYNGVMNIWVKKKGDGFENARPLTQDERPIPGYFWSRDSSIILYVQDRNGDENFNLFTVDPEGESMDRGVPESRALTEYEGVQTRVIALPRKKPEYIVVGINDRDPALHDVHLINIKSGERELLYKNNHNIASWTVDDRGRIRFAARQTPDGGAEILCLEKDEPERIYQVNFGESFRILRFHKDDERLYMVTNKGEEADLSRLVLFHPVTRVKELVEKDPENEVDFGGAIFSEVNRELLATFYTGNRQRIYFHDDQFERDYQKIREQTPDGDVGFPSRTRKEDLWLVSLSRDIDPGAMYLFDRTSGKVRFLYRSRPDLPVDHLARMKPVYYKARDGLEIPAYLTLPKGVKPENLAAVILPHGGPWIRDTWGYDAQVQFLANRGYAVLQPNFRGSSGYGKEFLNAGNQEWGTGYMQHDITDGVKYLVDKGLADPDRVGIYGASYGGFAALSGLAFTPDLYAAGVSMVGPSNLITLIRSIPPYWEPIMQSFMLRVGDPDDPGDRKRLKKQSPLFSVANIQAPLLVAQGANDPRVPKRESDQIVEALQKRKQMVRYIVAHDEGHGFARRLNRLAFYSEMERFFGEYLGGRVQAEVSAQVEQRLKEIIIYPENLGAFDHP